MEILKKCQWYSSRRKLKKTENFCQMIETADGKEL
jgi:hypothetical protein